MKKEGGYTKKTITISKPSWPTQIIRSCSSPRREPAGGHRLPPRPLGVPELPCREHPKSDENTGFIGYHLSQLLNCPAIIACNYFMDSNKHKGSDYYRKLQSLKPKMLVEIHGHCSSKVCADIEISPGRAARDHWSQEMAARLQVKLTGIPSLQEYTVSGDFTKIHLKATKSVTITSAEWVPFHIELPWPIRKSQPDPHCLPRRWQKRSGDC